MHPIAAVILAALLIEYVGRAIINILNLRGLRSPVPDELRGVYDPEEYDKSQRYTTATTHLRLIQNTYDLVLLLVFWFAGGFGWLDRFARGFGLAEIPTGLIYIGGFFLLGMLTDFPFSIYKTFVVEERFGFNRTTVATFIVDRLKGVSLGIVLGGGLAAALLAILRELGPSAWIYCWAVVSLVMILIQWLAPAVIMPLFNKYTPLEDGDLRTAILELGRKAQFGLANIFVVDGSKRSAKSNAYFTGFGRNKRVALYDTLIAQQETDELVAVVAHEIGHYKRHHIVQGTVQTTIYFGLFFFLFSVVVSQQGVFEAFHVATASNYAGLVLFMVLSSPFQFLIDPIFNYLLRRNEYEADSFAARTTGTPESLVRSLKKLAAANLSNLTPHPAYVAFNASHPPLRDRVEALRDPGR